MNRLPTLLAKRDALLLAAGIAVSVFLAGVPHRAHAQEKMKIAEMGGPLWDPFFGAMKKGADDAARDLNIDYQWITSTDANNFAADYAKLTKQAASQKPAAMVIGNYFPTTMDPIIKQIAASGIPVIIQHDGGATWQQDGATAYVGFDARKLGQAVGKLQTDAGAKSGLCVDHVPGNTTLDLDCKGYNDAFKAVLFIADLQPYLDGYYGILAAYQYAKYKMVPLGAIPTGPLILNKDNVDEVLKINKEFPGVRGAS